MSQTEKPPKTCAACGGAIVHSSHEEFCSLECYRAGRAFCKQCGKALVQRESGKKKSFCNNLCSGRYRTVGPSISPSYWEELERSTCKVCGKPIEQPKIGKRQFCSTICSQRYRNPRKRGLSITESWGGYAPETRKALRAIEQQAGIGLAKQLATAIDREYKLRVSDGPRKGNNVYLCKTCGKEFQRRQNSHRSKNYCSYACQPRKAKLTWEQVNEIRILHEQKILTQVELARKYNVSGRLINDIVRCKRLVIPHAKSLCQVGEKNSSATLTWDQVDEIRAIYAADEQVTTCMLGEVYGISMSNVESIIKGETWKPEHNPNHTKYTYIPPIQQRRARGEKNQSAKLTWEKVDEIRSFYASEQVTFKELAAIYGVSAGTVGNIIKNKNWKPEHDPRSKKE